MLNDPKETREFGYYFALSQAGIEMVMPLCIGAWIDYKLDWTPWATVTGAILGFVGGITHLLVMANRIEQRQTKQRDNKG